MRLDPPTALSESELIFLPITYRPTVFVNLLTYCWLSWSPEFIVALTAVIVLSVSSQIEKVIPTGPHGVLYETVFLISCVDPIMLGFVVELDGILVHEDETIGIDFWESKVSVSDSDFSRFHRLYDPEPVIYFPEPEIQDLGSYDFFESNQSDSEHAESSNSDKITNNGNQK